MNRDSMNMNKDNMNKYIKFVKLSFFPILIIYFETLLKAFTYDTLFNTGYIYMCFFSVTFGLIFYLFSTGFTEKTNMIIFLSIVFALTLLYGIQLIYHRIFSTFTSFYSIIGAKKVMQFGDVIFNTLLKNIPELIMMFLPMILILFYRKRLQLFLSKTSKKHIIYTIISAAAIHAVTAIAIISSNTGILSPSYLYKETFLIVNSIDKFGLLTTMRLDIKNILMENEIIAAELPEKEEPEGVDNIEPDKQNDEQNENLQEFGFNVMNIPFEELIAGESKEKIKNMHEYFSSIQPTKKNKYTGKYKGKNLIMITAEGFSPYAIQKELTPTLYKMREEGFKFNNFYTPIWSVSTSDGEYVACTGLIPKEGVWSFYKSSKNYLPFAMGNQLKKEGYLTNAYHNHYYDYYYRNESHPNLGYTYKGRGNGLKITETWPESDLEMIELTMPEFIEAQPFHIYYMTVSGHMNYTFYGNYMSMKNKSMVENLQYSENVKAYLSCNIEFDKAMERLIQELENKGIAEDTLIAISPDHYPYGLTLAEISELAGKEITDYDLYKGVFLLWSKNMEPVEINKLCSSLDIMPTLSNLMGLEYDSRLFMGKDIFSDSEPLVIFSDRSFITDKIFCNVRKNEVVSLNGTEIESSYIRELSETVKSKFKYSAMILDTDYYRIILK